MASVALGSKAVGSVVKIKVDGTLRNFIIVHQGLPSSLYDASCNGTWVLMEDVYDTRIWNGSNDNNFAVSSIFSFLNNTFLNKIDSDIQAQIKQVKIPYVAGGLLNNENNWSVNSGTNGLLCKIFLLTGVELGFIRTDTGVSGALKYLPLDGAKLSYFEAGTGTTANSKRIALKNGVRTAWWTRASFISSNNFVYIVVASGPLGNQLISLDSGIRPAMILPPDLLVSDDGTITINTAPTIPGSIAVPETIQSGKAVTVSWTASSDAESNLEGYIVERTLDGGTSWSQIYQGGALSTANTVPFGSETVQYRVKAYDSDGAASEYRTSAARTVINNVAPGVPEDFSVPELVQGGGTLAITWGAATDSDDNLSGYSLERQVDGGEWTEIYNGPALTFTDFITKGWEAVAYRLRAYDDLGVFGSYTAAQEREVNNNTPPEISCEAGELGEKTQGFAVVYSVSDEEGDAVTVEESVDGILLRKVENAAGEQTLSLTGEAFLVLANGGHEVKITATDGRGVSSHTLAFTKNVTAASVTLTEPMTADAKISLCVLSVGGSIPDDANFAVEVTNNGLDEAPVWEDCTAQVKAGMNHVFENETAANGFAFNFRVAVERGESGAGGYITSIQGGFQ